MLVSKVTRVNMTSHINSVTCLQDLTLYNGSMASRVLSPTSHLQSQNAWPVLPLVWAGEEAGRETGRGSLDPTEINEHTKHPAMEAIRPWKHFTREGGTDLKLLVHIIIAFIQVLMQQSPFIFDVNVGIKSS